MGARRDETPLALEVATPDDLAALLPLVRAYHAFDGVPHDDRTREAVVRPLLADPALGRVFFIREGGEIAGYVALCFGYSIEFTGRDAFVDEFFVVEGRRGRGLGRRALEAVLEEARRLGVRAVHLEVARGNQRARSLYESLGFSLREGFHLMSRRL
jgi:GNAT superfamily N-acetyltransferase